MKIKIAINFILISLFFFCVTYLLASFYSTTFDITKWKEDTRAIVSVMGGLFSMLISILIMAFQFFENPQNK